MEEEGSGPAPPGAALPAPPVSSKGPSSDGHWTLLLRLGDPLRLREVKSLLAAAGIEGDIVEGEVITRGGTVIRPKGGRAQGGAASGAGAMEQEEEEESADVLRSGGFEVEGPATLEYAKVRALIEAQYVCV